MTYTASQTSTYTEARAKYVMDKIFDDFTALIIRGFTTQEKILSWKNDLLYLMSEQVLDYFEIQLIKPDGTKAALRYYVKADNSLSQDAASGTLGLYSLPVGTTTGLLAKLDENSANYTRANEELHINRGWGYGNSTEGNTEKHHSYSKEGYGVERNKIGTW